MFITVQVDDALPSSHYFIDQSSQEHYGPSKVDDCHTLSNGVDLPSLWIRLVLHQLPQCIKHRGRCSLETVELPLLEVLMLLPVLM